MLKALTAACTRAGFLVALLLGIGTASVAKPTPAAPWLFVADIHVDPTNRASRPSVLGEDTNAPLLQSAIAAMRRADPDPPVIVLGGDFVGHQRIDARGATAIVTDLARRFNQAFPRAQFVMTLGNEDSPCRDYGIATGGAFLRAIAAAWAPLVDRRGAAPGFSRTFARDGFYTATLPVPGLRVVVVDDVFWSPRFHACGSTRDGEAATLAELAAALRGPGGTRSWVLMHIPPGIDAFSTAHLVHRLAVVPFLDPDPRQRFTALVDDPADRVALVIAGHTHKFAYRIVDAARSHPVPILLVPAVSPIFRNEPSFLTVEVGADGTIGDAHEFSLLAGRWQNVGSLHDLGVTAFTVPALRNLQARLARDPALRARFARIYNGGAPPEITEGNWRTYWCAAQAFSSTNFRTCLNAGGYSILTGRGIVAVVVLIAAMLAVLAMGMLAFRRATLHRKRARGRPPGP